VNSKVEQIWKDAVVAYFEMLPFNVSGGTESNLGTEIVINMNVLLDSIFWKCLCIAYRVSS
jgi:hypothetical protein